MAAHLGRLLSLFGILLLSNAVASEIASGPVDTNTEHNSNDGTGGKKTIADLAWDDYYRKVNDGDPHATMGLLKLFNCPLYSDIFGVGYQETKIEVSGRVEGLSNAPYSRLPTEEETWKFFEEAYYFAVGMEQPTSSTEKETHNQNEFGRWRGMNIPFEVRYDSKIGRALYTTTHIPKGTLVWDGSYTATFTSPMVQGSEGIDSTPTFPTYRRFMEYLHDHSSERNKQQAPHDWACDALMWTYISAPVDEKSWLETGDGEDFLFNMTHQSLCVAFDHGSLFNDSKGNPHADTLEDTYYSKTREELRSSFGLEGYARKSAQDEDDAPLKKISLQSSECQHGAMQASRDLQKGEELRYDYGIFDNDDDDDDDDNYYYYSYDLFEDDESQIMES